MAHPEDTTSQKSQRAKLSWRFTIAYALALFSIVILAGLGRLSGVLHAIHNVPLGDKIAHFLLVGSLAYVLNLSLGRRGVRVLGVRLLYGGLIVFCVMTLEEISQHWLVTRRFDLGDMLANTLGILLFSYLAARRLTIYDDVPAATEKSTPAS